jgi:hypothetical protein
MGITNAQRLLRVQDWIGKNKYGIIMGVENKYQPLSWYQSYINGFGTQKPDVVYIKTGELGQDFTLGMFPQIRNMFMAAGMGCVPYIYPRPGLLVSDVANAVKYGKIAGGVQVDAEELFTNQPAALTQLLADIRQGLGDGPVILVTGYADPQTATPGWDFAALKYVDCYQPQMYTGYWTHANTEDGWEPLVNWARKQLAAVLVQGNLGIDYPMAPIFNTENIPTEDWIFSEGEWALEQFFAAFTLWEIRDTTVTERARARNACIQVALQEAGK